MFPLFAALHSILLSGMLVLMIGRKVENLNMIATTLKDEKDLDIIVWSGLTEDYDKLREICKPHKPDIVCVGDGLPPDTRSRIIDKLSKEYEDFNLPEIPKYAFLRNVGPNEKPDVIAKIMSSGDKTKIQELKDKKLGPYGTPQFVLDAVKSYQESGNL